MPLALMFAAIAGYADAIGYLRFKAFAGMMTGNTVFLGLAIFHRADLPALQYAEIIALFFAAACIGFAVLRLAPMRLPVLLFEAAMLMLAGASAARWAVIPLVIAMGVQNPLARRLGISVNTTFITGDIVHFAQESVARLWPSKGQRGPTSPMTGLTWFAYLAGAILGTLGFRYLGWPLLVPVAGLAYILWQVARG